MVFLGFSEPWGDAKTLSLGQCVDGFHPCAPVTRQHRPREGTWDGYPLVLKKHWKNNLFGDHSESFPVISHETHGFPLLSLLMGDALSPKVPGVWWRAAWRVRHDPWGVGDLPAGWSDGDGERDPEKVAGFGRIHFCCWFGILSRDKRV